jgi:hypothetical protein
VHVELQIARYYQLKLMQKEIEDELDELKKQILEAHPDAGSVEAGEYKLTVHFQERREYNDERLYNALPDPSLWRLLSKADAGKISSLIKLQVIHDGILEGTYQLRKIPTLRVQKK